ncbi:uncharacterized protein VTP21DRAFT_11444 [Calcarisporiella thermophila]|uniref:uncharacterized protein n=1 Tax=Calcarisporiella thermophila TaxID=911321 RepID=UPI0037422279
MHLTATDLWMFLFLISISLAIYFFRHRLLAIFERVRYQRIPRSSNFEQDIEDGLTSETFDLNQNLEQNDTRPGLDSEEIRLIMKREGVSFDQARLLRQQRKLKANNVDPATGLPLDPKAVFFS